MICPNCNRPTGRMIIRNGFKGCAECWGMSNTGGAHTDGILTRSSDRVRQQQLVHEGDTIAPHVFDKAAGKPVPNPDFVERYPDQIPTYFTEGEMRKAGYSQIDKLYKHKAAKEKAHKSGTNDGVTYKNPDATINPGKPASPRKR